MSSLNEYALIIATLISGTVSVTYIGRRANQRSDQIVTGVVEGVPVSKKHRSMMLYNEFLPMVATMAMLSFLLAFAMIGIAEVVTTDKARTLAYLSAGFGGFGFLFNGVLGGLYAVHCASVLRQSARD
jgi:hypothetical protein